MAFTLLDLLQGTTPTFDAQAIPDSTDWAILAAAHAGYGVAFSQGFATAPCSLCTSTAVTTASPITLSSLTGSASVPTTGSISPLTWPNGGGYFSCPTTGGGTAVVSFTGLSGINFTNCTYISGGSGSIAASTTLTSQFAIQLGAAQHMVSEWVDINYSGLGGTVSLQAPGGGFAALPASAGDRKDLVVVNTSGSATTIVQGTACSQVDWTRNNGSYTNAPPAKPAWSSSTPVALCEVYVPGIGSSHGNLAIGVGNLTDKSVVATLNFQPLAPTILGTDFTITSTAEAVALTTASVPIGQYMVFANAEFSVTSAAQCSARVFPTASGGATLAGPSKAPADGTWVVAAEYASVSLVGYLSISGAGTLDLRVQTSVGSSNAKVKATDVQNSWANTTQINLLRIA